MLWFDVFIVPQDPLAKVVGDALCLLSGHVADFKCALGFVLVSFALLVDSLHFKESYESLWESDECFSGIIGVHWMVWCGVVSGGLLNKK